MVEVITSKDFEEFKKIIEDRLDKIEKSTEKGADDLTKAVKKLTALLDESSATIIERVDEVEENSKSFWTRIKEVIETKEAKEPVPE